MLGLVVGLLLAQPWVPTGGATNIRQGWGLTDAGHPWAFIPQDPHNGQHGNVSPIGDLVVGEPTRLIGPSFGSTLDTNFWTCTVFSGAAGDAGCYVSGSVATLGTGTTADAGVYLQSNRRARFMFAHPNKFRAAIRLPSTSSAGNTRTWGVDDGTDGLGFGHNGSLYVYRRRNGTITTVASGAFNGELGRSYTLDTNVHAFEIHYFTMGVWWLVDGRLLHRWTPTTTPPTGMLTLPIRLYDANASGGTAIHQLEAWNTSVLRLGNSYAKPIYAHIATSTTTTLKRGAGTLHALAVNTGGAGSSATFYDNTAGSGTVIAVSSGTGVAFFPYDVDFYTGLTVVTAGGSPADLTVIYD